LNRYHDLVPKSHHALHSKTLLSKMRSDYSSTRTAIRAFIMGMFCMMGLQINYEGKNQLVFFVYMKNAIPLDHLVMYLWVVCGACILFYPFVMIVAEFLILALRAKDQIVEAISQIAKVK
jgi:hypothetical protein